MRLSVVKSASIWVLSLLGPSLATSSHIDEDAPITVDNGNGNGAGTTYTAMLLQSAVSQVRGTMTVAGGIDGVGVSFTLMLTGLPGPEEDGYVYHINTLPVPEDGNCAATGAILDPFNAGVTADCTPTNPSACRVGDLSSKHGSLPSYNYLAVFTDDYLSLNTEDPAFLGNRSIVISTSNGTAVNCGNFTLLGEGITHPLPLNPPPALNRPMETSSFSEPSLPAQAPNSFVTEAVASGSVVNARETALSSSVLSSAMTSVTGVEQASTEVTHPLTLARSTSMGTGTAATALVTEYRMPCASQMYGTGLMTGSAVMTAPSGVACGTGSSGLVLCTPTAASAAYHSPTVSSPASDARSIQIGRSNFKTVAVVAGAMLGMFL